MLTVYLGRTALCAIALPAGPVTSPPTGGAACTLSRYWRGCLNPSGAPATTPRAASLAACSRGCDGPEPPGGLRTRRTAGSAAPFQSLQRVAAKFAAGSASLAAWQTPQRMVGQQQRGQREHDHRADHQFRTRDAAGIRRSAVVRRISPYRTLSSTGYIISSSPSAIGRLVPWIPIRFSALFRHRPCPYLSGGDDRTGGRQDGVSDEQRYVGLRRHVDEAGSAEGGLQSVDEIAGGQPVQVHGHLARVQPDPDV